jgi:N-acetyl-gamma-glutamyl-phosphate reductase
LRRHPSVSIGYLASRRLTKPEPVGKLLPEFRADKNLFVEPYDPAKIAARCDLVFLALPHGEAMKLASALLKKSEMRIVDLSGDFRIKNKTVFKNAYGFAHTDSKNLKSSAYGLTELFRESIRDARLVANPGCYPTASLLALAPLAHNKLLPGEGVIIDAKSGVSGAGRSAKEELLFCELNEEMRAYKVGNHQHTPEMEQALGWIGKKKIELTFTPHLVPLNRGMYVTAYVPLTKKMSYSAVSELYRSFYHDEPFIRILPEGIWPQVRSVAQTNDCEIGLYLDRSGKRLTVLSAIDNLGKGASGQAVQNMNLLFGFPETTGIRVGHEGQ